MGSQPSTPRPASVTTSPQQEPPAGGVKERKTIKNKSSYQPKDVMISYSHADSEICKKLRESLESNGISVWVDFTGLSAGVDFLSKIGQAIIDAKVFISLLSESTVKSKYCQDELALAYVSNKPIFPVSFKTPDELFPIMDTGMKLQLARFEWHPISEENYDNCIKALVSSMKGVMEIQAGGQEKKDEEKKQTTDSSSSPSKRPELQRQATRTALRNKKKDNKASKIPLNRLDSYTAGIDEGQKSNFWEANFGLTVSIPWTKFQTVFIQVFGEAITKVFSAGDVDWICRILHRELEVGEDDMVHRDRYNEFCTIDNEEQPFWQRVQDQAVESYSMREVFNMDSSVRIEAIENLGKFHSSAVIEALLDLLSDKDNNVKAVAAISLAKTGVKNNRIVNGLLRTLNDKDRLVRESGCLALGHIKAEAAVPKLVALWRNDFISTVREGAHLALEQIGGKEAEKAIHMTKVLAEEIRMLTKE